MVQQSASNRLHQALNSLEAISAASGRIAVTIRSVIFIRRSGLDYAASGAP